ncbi:MAG TPA: LysR family transcriptional regulator [Methylophilus sp.]
MFQIILLRMVMMRITLRQLQIFIAIAQSGSTTAAGEVIALSQSAISASIAELEKALNVQLFDRVGKRLLLNDHGRAMLPQAMALVNGATSLENSFNEIAPSILIIGASLTIGNYLLPTILANYWRAQGIVLGELMPPLQVVVANTADIVSKVVNFEVDIGLIEGPCNRVDISVSPWLEDELLLVVAPNHPVLQENGEFISPDRLTKANWLLRERGSGTREALEQALLPYIAQLKSSLEFNDHEAIKQSAVQGLGIACLSRTVVRDMLDAGKLVELKTPFGKLMRRFSLLVHHQKQVTPGMQHFMNHIFKNQKDT